MLLKKLGSGTCLCGYNRDNIRKEVIQQFVWFVQMLKIALVRNKLAEVQELAYFFLLL